MSPTPIRRGALLASLCALAVLAGCASHPHARFGTEVDVSARRAEVRDALGRKASLPAVALRVARPRPAAAEGRAAPAAAAPGEPGTELEFDERFLGAELAQVLEATGLFAAVIRLDDLREGTDIEDAKLRARERGASFLLDASVGAPSLRRTERPIILPCLLWAAGGWLSCWDHNHTYELTFTLDVRIHDLAADALLPDPRLPPARAQDELDFFERSGGLGYLCLLSCCWPSPLCPVDPDEIARALAPAALKKPVVKLLDHLTEQHGAAYAFRRQFKDGGPKIRVSYPPADPAPVLIFGARTMYSFVAEAPPGTTLAEVRINDERVFPNPDRRLAQAPKRILMPFEDSREVRPGGSFTIEVVDSRGARSSCVISSLRR
jgi:hypothetical protein